MKAVNASALIHNALSSRAKRGICSPSRSRTQRRSLPFGFAQGRDDNRHPMVPGTGLEFSRKRIFNNLQSTGTLSLARKTL